MKILVIGAAGFIGSKLCSELINYHEVIGIDSFVGDDVQIKCDRLKHFFTSYPYSNKIVKWKEYRMSPTFTFIKGDFINDNNKLRDKLINEGDIDVVIHLGERAGVRNSFENKYQYLNDNVVNFMKLMDIIKNMNIKHFIYASSSSVYGDIPNDSSVNENSNSSSPISIYAMTKKSNELISHIYSHKYKIPMTILRFFTVYGPWCRPDMGMMKFATSIKNNTPIELYNDGNLLRDFTYIDDIVDGIMKTVKSIPSGDTPYKIYNLGSNNPIKISDLICLLEEITNKKAIKKCLPMQDGDVHSTYADIDLAKRELGFYPKTSLKTGLKNFIDWFNSYTDGSILKYTIKERYKK